MQTRSLILALTLASQAGATQAATWGMVAGTTQIGGQRAIELGLDGQDFVPVSASHADDPVNLGQGWFDAYGDSRVEGESAAGNRRSVFASQESHGDADPNGDGRMAALGNLALLDASGQFIGAGQTSTQASAHALTEQSFRIVAEAGESEGDPVWLDLGASFQRYSNEPSLGRHGFQLSLRVNGTEWFSHLPEDHEDAVQHGQLVRIGDVVTLGIQSWAEVDVPPTPFVAGDEPWLLTTSGQSASLILSPIPEPETWGMLLMGLGLVGLQLRKKSKTITPLKIGA